MCTLSHGLKYSKTAHMEILKQRVHEKKLPHMFLNYIFTLEELMLRVEKDWRMIN